MRYTSGCSILRSSKGGHEDKLIGIETQFKNAELGLSRCEGERMSHIIVLKLIEKNYIFKEQFYERRSYMEEELYFKGKPLSELDLNGIAEAASLLHRAVPEPPTCCSDWRYEGEERDRDALMQNLGREDLYFMGKQLSELSLDEIAKASSLLVMALGAKTPEDYDGCRCNGDAAHDVVAYAWDAVWILDSEVTEALHNAQFENLQSICTSR